MFWIKFILIGIHEDCSPISLIYIASIIDVIIWKDIPRAAGKAVVKKTYVPFYWHCHYTSYCIILMFYTYVTHVHFVSLLKFHLKGREMQYFFHLFISRDVPDLNKLCRAPMCQPVCQSCPNHWFLSPLIWFRSRLIFVLLQEWRFIPGDWHCTFITHTQLTICCNLVWCFCLKVFMFLPCPKEISI